ncbi:MAG: hypothetical protein U1E53_29560 [Dongiaceae bacterium]
MHRSIVRRIPCLTAILAMLAGAAMAGGFSEDPDIRRIAEAYALDAVDVARQNFGEKLDWSEGSIAKVEAMLAILHDSYVTAAQKPGDETVQTFAKMFGSYVGEVYRRHHGGTWGMVTIDGARIPGIEDTSGGAFWPWGKVANRIRNGPDDNVLLYYKLLVRDAAKAPGSPPPD